MKDSPSPSDGRRTRWVRPRERGVVTLELIIALPAIMLFIMSVFQVTHDRTARQLVAHAAQRGARAAAIWQAEPGVDLRAKAREAAALTLVPISPAIAEPTAQGLGQSLATRLTAHGGDGAGPPPRDERWSVQTALDGGIHIGQRAAAKADYALRATMVREVTRAPRGGPVTVHVEYAFYCGMPFAAWFYCDSWAELPWRWRTSDHLGAAAGLSKKGRYLIIESTATHIAAPLPGGG